MSIEGHPSAKRRYVTLDAMRGVAAIAVVMRHFGHAFHGWEPDSYLAVDLFFILSGFVLALNYDALFASGMTAVSFIRLRAIRLLPFALIGASLGLLSQLIASPTRLDPFQSVISAILTAIAAPTPPFVAPGILFPLNTVFWSLFFELWVANVIFAVFWRWIRGPCLWALIVLGAVGLLIGQRQFHVLDIGWGWDNVWAGFPRVIFSFFAGVAIQRFHMRHSLREIIPSWVCLVFLISVLLFPFQGNIGNLIKLGVIFFIFPASVYFGTGAAEKKSGIGKLLGDVSYGVYTLHIPILAVLAWAMSDSTHKTRALNAFEFFALEGVFVAVILALAFILDTRVDRPLRRRLLAWTKGMGNAPLVKVGQRL